MSRCQNMSDVMSCQCHLDSAPVPDDSGVTTSSDLSLTDMTSLEAPVTSLLLPPSRLPFTLLPMSLVLRLSSEALFLALQLLEVLLLLALSAAVSDSSSENTARLE